MRRQARLIYNPDTAQEQVYPFVDQVVIGRRKSRGVDVDGRISLRDPAISGRHCVIRQAEDGRFYVRDESRNGTRVSGRRLVPNVEVEVRPGEVIQVARDHNMLLSVEVAQVETEYESEGETQAIVNAHTLVTILVGDIRNYTTMSQQLSADAVYGSVGKVFSALERVVMQNVGTIKEYQGDAIFAFWEADEEQPGVHAMRACACALALDAEAQRIANDPSIWAIREFPLEMDWALTTGTVLISTMGGDRPTGLAMVGDAVNYAFRLEKLADETTGKILTDDSTERLARAVFRFRSLGERLVKGRSEAEPVFVLEGRSF
jgi:adenylate cyclase